MTCDTCDAESKYYVGDVGTEIIVDTCSDITTATVVSLRVKKPDATLHTWTGAVYEVTNIRYFVVADDFDQIGYYTIQSYVEMPTGTWRGNSARVKIQDPFE